MGSPKLTVNDVTQFLDRFAPPALAEGWDNVGLLVGDGSQPVARIMTCLTVTPASAAEAIEQRADLIVSHHPFPFSALKRITRASTAGSMLLDLIAAKIAVYSPHTAFDSAAQGINQRLAEGLQLLNVVPLIPASDATTGGQAAIGTARVGTLSPPIASAELATRTKKLLKVEQLQIVGAATKMLTRVAVACGSAGELMPAAIAAQCDAMVTGELRFHSCLEAEAHGLCVLLPGHYASERFAVEQLADVLAGQFAGTSIWASRDEADPLGWL